MSRKTVYLGLGLLVLLAGTAVVLGVLVYRVPTNYLHAAPPAGLERERLSRQFVGEVASFLSSIKDNYDQEKKEPWYACFTEDTINSYLAEDFAKHHSQLGIPRGITAPRIAIKPDRICLAFKYGNSAWSPIVSVDLGVWLPKGGEPNALCLEIQGLHAGCLPVSSQSLLEQVYESARKYNVDVTWYRHNGNPVALLRFQNDQRTPTVQLQSLELQQGTLTVVGKSWAAMLPASGARQDTN